MFSLEVTRYFDAAHYLRGYKGKCANLHGHSWKVTVVSKGEELNNQGMLIDFIAIKRALDNILEQYDHHCLNEVSPFNTLNPTAELIARVIFIQLQSQIADLESVTINESPDCGATYYE